MSKFNVGDTVRRIPGGSGRLRAGEVGNVKAVYGRHISISERPGMWWNEHYFELVERAPIGDPDDSPRDDVNHPKHYTSDPSGVECIQITRHRNFNIGNAFKYLWRLGLKESAGKTAKEKKLQDIDKAVWYLLDERKRIEAEDE